MSLATIKSMSILLSTRSSFFNEAEETFLVLLLLLLPFTIFMWLFCLFPDADSRIYPCDVLLEDPPSFELLAFCKLIFVWLPDRTNCSDLWKSSAKCKNNSTKLFIVTKKKKSEIEHSFCSYLFHNLRIGEESYELHCLQCRLIHWLAVCTIRSEDSHKPFVVLFKSIRTWHKWLP